MPDVVETSTTQALALIVGLEVVRKMSEASEQGMLDDRDTDTLSFNKVIELQLKPGADGKLRSSSVPLAASSVDGLICLTGSAGVIAVSRSTQSTG